MLLAAATLAQHVNWIWAQTVTITFTLCPVELAWRNQIKESFIMKMNIKSGLAIIALALWISCNAHAYPGESVELNPVTGDYAINYWNGIGLEQTLFVPATKIVPTVKSRFYLDAANKIVYRYSVSNSHQSKQSIVQHIFESVNSVDGTRDDSRMGISTPDEYATSMAVLRANHAALTTPAGWDGGVVFGYYDDERVRVAWDTAVDHVTDKSMDGIKPGNKVNDFGFTSTALAGISVVEFMGNHPPRAYPVEGPLEDSAIIQQLNDIEANDFVPRNAAVPTIAVPVPFDAAVLLDRIRTHVATWPGKQLLDPTFAAQLDRYMAAAAEAYRLNSTKAGRENIMTVRKLLGKEHHNLDHDEDDDDTEEHKTATRLTIDRLAARVLDFDLRYVLKRIEHEHEDGDRRKER